MNANFILPCALFAGAVILIILILCIIKKLLNAFFKAFPYWITAPFCGIVIGSSAYSIVRFFLIPHLMHVPSYPKDKVLLTLGVFCAVAAAVSLIVLKDEYDFQKKYVKEQNAKRKTEAEKQRKFDALVEKCAGTQEFRDTVTWLKGIRYDVITFGYDGITVSQVEKQTNILGETVGQNIHVNAYERKLNLYCNDDGCAHGSNALRYAFATALQKELHLLWEDDNEQKFKREGGYECVNFFIRLKR